HKVRDPNTGRRVARAREGEKPIRGAEAPHLRIVSDELWRAVQARQELVKRLYADSGKHAGLLRSKAMNVRYLFSGLLKCKTCGANMQIVAGRGRNHNNQTYGCPMNFSRGDSVCPNRTRVRRDVLERQLLAGLQEKVLREEVVNYIIDRFEVELTKELKSIGGEMERMRKRKGELDIQIANLADGLAMGIHSPTIMVEIAKREREVSEISDRLLSSRPESIHSRIEKLRTTVIVRIHDLRKYLNSDTATARAHLIKHVEAIVMEPTGKTYVASGSWNLLGDGRWAGAEGQS
ncbi:MAG: zinc ribbon domain-containing protein, partial [Candidatus Acidiferrales bacterium]